MDSTTRIAYHSGSWYEDDPKLLAKEIGSYLSNDDKKENFNSLKSIIVPHAGYTFCGPTAGKSFININPSNFDRAVVLGPSHHVGFKACGLTPYESFETPFGDVKVDTNTINKLLSKKDLFFTLPESVDVKEHSIEMEMPFLKYIFNKKDFSLVPIMVGHNDLLTNTEIGKALYDLYEDPKTLFVISSDFCHWGQNFGFTYYNNQFENISDSTRDLDMQALQIISEMNSAKMDQYFKKKLEILYVAEILLLLFYLLLKIIKKIILIKNYLLILLDILNLIKPNQNMILQYLMQELSISLCN